jgi:hypothetical protein
MVLSFFLLSLLLDLQISFASCFGKQPNFAFVLFLTLLKMHRFSPSSSLCSCFSDDHCDLHCSIAPSIWLGRLWWIGLDAHGGPGLGAHGGSMVPAWMPLVVPAPMPMVVPASMPMMILALMPLDVMWCFLSTLRSLT